MPAPVTNISLTQDFLSPVLAGRNAGLRVRTLLVAARGMVMNTPLAAHTTISIDNLAAGASANYSGSYYPTQALTAGGVSTLADPELSLFKNQVMAHGTKPAIVGGGTQNSPATEATCPLCGP